MATGREHAPEFYIRVFSRGAGEVNLKNVISIKTSHSVNSSTGSFAIELDYRESGFGALDSFFRIEPMDFVEIYLRRKPGGIGRWTEVKKILNGGNYTENNKLLLARGSNGAWTTKRLERSTEYPPNSIVTKQAFGLDFFNSNANDDTNEVDKEIINEGLKGFNKKTITIAKLNFIENKPLTFSERIYNPDLVMVGFVDKISNNFGLTDTGTQNRIIISGSSVAKFLKLHAITQEVTKLALGNLDVTTDKVIVDENATEEERKSAITQKEEQIRSKGLPKGITDLMVNLLKLNIVRYHKLVNLGPNEAAWMIFEEYIAKILGNTKPSDSTWTEVGDPLDKTEYGIKFGPNAISKNLTKEGIDDPLIEIFDEQFIELENPEIDPDLTNNNSNLEIVRFEEELRSRSGYSVSQRDGEFLAKLHFYDSPWTYIYTSFNKDSSLDPYSRIATDVGPRGAVEYTNPGLGNGNFFAPIWSILQRLSNGNINEVFVDEKGFLTLRRRINAFDQTRFLKTDYQFLPSGGVGLEATFGFVDKKYGAYKGLEDEHNRIIIQDGEILNWSFNRSDENLKSIIIIRPTMLQTSGLTAYYLGWRTTMPQTLNNIFNNINFNTDTSLNAVTAQDQILQNISPDLPKSIREFVGLNHLGSTLAGKVVDTLYRNKFSSIFSPPLKNEFQILNFWQRYGFRTIIADDFFSSNHSFAQLTAVELFEKYNNSWWNGEVSLSGDPKYRAGKVVEIPNIPAKFYCHSVSHNFIWGEKYTTTIGVMMGKIIKTPTSTSVNGKRSDYASTLLNNINGIVGPIVGS